MDWATKRVLVTGADGFIGSHLAEYLVRLGAEVRALALYNSFGSYGYLDHSELRSSFHLRMGDVRDRRSCQRLVEGVDVVFHLAALVGIPYSYVAPESYIETNVTGSMNLALAAMDAGCGRFVHTSTSEVYGSAIRVPIEEGHPLQPQSPYSASKIAADSMLRSLFYTFDFPVIVARPFNTYGPRQSTRAIIPTIISQVLEGQGELVLGDTAPTRDFSYVADTCKAFVELAECDQALGMSVHFGSGREISISQLVELIGNLMNVTVTIREDAKRVRPKGSEVRRLWADNGLIESLTGYAPEHSLEAGIRETIDWLSQPDKRMGERALHYAL